MAIFKNSVNNFSSLLIDDVLETFELKENRNLDFNSIKSSSQQRKLLKRIIQKAQNQIEYWNEQELIIKYLSFILGLINFQGANYNTFAERNLSAVVNGIELAGTIDFMVASGQHSPKNPYFFIQEYKRYKLGPNSDPFAQLLGEMLVAQQLNNDDLVYGCYIIGRFWYFVVLQNQEYKAFEPLDSANESELKEIIEKLNFVKKYIEDKLIAKL